MQQKLCYMQLNFLINPLESSAQYTQRMWKEWNSYFWQYFHIEKYWNFYVRIATDSKCMYRFSTIYFITISTLRFVPKRIISRGHTKYFHKVEEKWNQNIRRTVLLGPTEPKKNCITAFFFFLFHSLTGNCFA